MDGQTGRTGPLVDERGPDLAAIVVLTVAEAAALLKVGRSKVYVLMKSGELRWILVGGTRRIRLTALLDYLDNQETSAA